MERKIFAGIKTENEYILTLLPFRMIKQGYRGDATLLKPTVMLTVPLMLDRITKAIKEKIKNGSPIAQKFFYWAYEYR